MKAFKVVGGLALSGLIAVGVGCGQRQEQAPPSVGEAQKSAEEAATEMQKETETPPAAPSRDAQGLIDQAKILIESKKYVEALEALKQASNLQLTPEQQKLVDELKALVQKNMAEQGASEAGKAAGDLLGGQK